MTDPQIALLMLGLFLGAVMFGFPIAFTLMAMGIGFGYYAYFDEGRMWRSFDRALRKDADDLTLLQTWIEGFFNSRIFDLFINQTYTVMANEVLTAVPLFLFMGYIVERANIVDRLFYTLNISAKNLPGSMGIAALITCALFATATGIVGAVVTLMGLLAFPAMLKARYDSSFASGIICAGGTLGILIPPSIMLIVYAAASGTSIVRLYAGALLPGFMLAGLYLIYVVGRSIAQPEMAPRPSKDEVPDIPLLRVIWMLLTSFLPLAALILAVLGSILGGLATPSEAASVGAMGGLLLAVAYRADDADYCNGMLSICRIVYLLLSFLISWWRADNFGICRASKSITCHLLVIGAINYLPSGMASGMVRDHNHFCPHLLTITATIRY